MRFVLALLLVGCAADTRSRWERDEIIVCAEGPEASAAAAAWAFPGVPKLIVSAEPGCAVEVSYGETLGDFAVTRSYGAPELRLAFVRLSRRVPFGDATVYYDVVDLQGVLTHEFGHVLGLDDSIDEGSVMDHDIAPGDLHHRRITWNDARALMELYR